MTLDLSDAERAALLSATVAADRFPRSPRIRALQRVLDKLEPPTPKPEQHPPPKPPGEPSWALRKRSRR